MSNQIELIYHEKSLYTRSDKISVSLNGYWITNGTNGYWMNIGKLPICLGNFTLFKPGVYTVKASDYFNQTILEYFTVT